CVSDIASGAVGSPSARTGRAQLAQGAWPRSRTSCRLVSVNRPDRLSPASSGASPSDTGSVGLGSALAAPLSRSGSRASGLWSLPCGQDNPVPLLVGSPSPSTLARLLPSGSRLGGPAVTGEEEGGPAGRQTALLARIDLASLGQIQNHLALDA